MSNPSFVHLDVNTQYSLGRSTITDQLIDACTDMGMPAVGVTDHNNLFLHISLQVCSKERHKDSMDQPLPSRPKRANQSKLSLLCENETGYKNLCALITKSYTEKIDKNDPLIEQKWLESAQRIDRNLLFLQWLSSEV